MSNQPTTDPAARQALITDHPPRIPPSQDEAIVRAARQSMAKLTGRSDDGADIPLANIPEMLLTVMCNGDLYEKVADVSLHLLRQGTLSPRDRELVVLRTTWLCQSPYNFGEHVRIAKREHISSEEIERATVGSSAPGWSDYDRALVKAAEELHGAAMISDDTWAVLQEHLSDKQLFELIVLVGQFTLVTYFQNTLRLRLSAGNQGLLGR
jgi:alkylhydroperoxidase family enzyme